MNKQEAIERINNESWEYWGYIPESVIETETVRNIISQIDEPQKVAIPQEVAKWIELNRNLKDVQTAFSLLGQRKTEVSLWVNENVDTFARAWLDGYEVEQEKRYVVNLGIKLGMSIYLRKTDKQLYPDREDWSTTGYVRFAEKLTESKIKQDFEWAWQFAQEVE